MAHSATSTLAGIGNEVVVQVTIAKIGAGRAVAGIFRINP